MALLLETLVHYLQPANADPRPAAILPGVERIEIVTGGRGWVRSGEDWIETFPGDIWWHVEGDETIGRSDFDNPYRCLNVVLRQTTRPACRRPVPHRTQWIDLAELIDFTTRCVAFSLDSGIDRSALRDYVLGRILIEARRPARGDASASRTPIVRRAQKWLEAHAADPIRIGELARRLGCSPAHLHEHFRTELGLTPHAYLTEVRIRAARARLALTRDPIKQIGIECGFPRPAAFCHAFRRATGESPGTFRSRQQALYGEGQTGAPS